MPLYKVHTIKHMNLYGESWENVYTILVADVAETESMGDAFVAAEKAVSYDPVSFDGFIVYPNAGGPAVFRKLGYVGQGDLPSAGLGGPLPLFNTVRVTFGNPLGRPEVKYLRLGANVDNVENGIWSAEFRDFVDEFYTQEVYGMLPYVGPNGELHNSAATQQAIQMRQLGWHRRSLPGFHRGWVPD